MKIGKLDVRLIDLDSLGKVVQITAPEQVTDLPEDISSVKVAISLETAKKLATQLNKLVTEQEQKIKDSFCGAV
jgi:hypothetical protein